MEVYRLRNRTVVKNIKNPEENVKAILRTGNIVAAAYALFTVAMNVLAGYEDIKGLVMDKMIRSGFQAPFVEPVPSICLTNESFARKSSEIVKSVLFQTFSDLSKQKVLISKNEDFYIEKVLTDYVMNVYEANHPFEIKDYNYTAKACIHFCSLLKIDLAPYYYDLKSYENPEITDKFLTQTLQEITKRVSQAMDDAPRNAKTFYRFVGYYSIKPVETIDLLKNFENLMITANVKSIRAANNKTVVGIVKSVQSNLQTDQTDLNNAIKELSIGIQEKNKTENNIVIESQILISENKTLLETAVNLFNDTCFLDLEIRKFPKKYQIPKQNTIDFGKYLKDEGDSVELLNIKGDLMLLNSKLKQTKETKTGFVETVKIEKEVNKFYKNVIKELIPTYPPPPVTLFEALGEESINTEILRGNMSKLREVYNSFTDYDIKARGFVTEKVNEINVKSFDLEREIMKYRDTLSAIEQRNLNASLNNQLGQIGSVPSLEFARKRYGILKAFLEKRKKRDSIITLFKEEAERVTKEEVKEEVTEEVKEEVKYELSEEDKDPFKSFLTQFQLYLDELETEKQAEIDENNFRKNKIEQDKKNAIFISKLSFIRKDVVAYNVDRKTIPENHMLGSMPGYVEELGPIDKNLIAYYLAQRNTCIWFLNNEILPLVAAKPKFRPEMQRLKIELISIPKIGQKLTMAYTKIYEKLTSLKQNIESSFATV